jgi:hypothetical protein
MIHDSVLFGDHIVYVDESGSPGLEKIDPQYPIFVLAFCIFEKQRYADTVVPNMMRFKFKHFGHDQVVLHEHEIKKAKHSFAFLTDAVLREAFYADLHQLVFDAPFTIVAVVVDKNQLRERYLYPANPYMLAMEYGLERVCHFLLEHQQGGKVTHFLFERRGEKEDRELELEFRRVSDDTNSVCSQTPVEIIMTDKKAVSSGLQMADLVARPLGLHVLRPNQPNRAYDTLKTKLRTGPDGRIQGYGLKQVP